MINKFITLTNLSIIIGIFSILSLFTDLFTNNLLISLVLLIGILILIVFEITNLLPCCIIPKFVNKLNNNRLSYLIKFILIFSILISIITLCIILQVNNIDYILSIILLSLYSLLNLYMYIKNYKYTYTNFIELV